MQFILKYETFSPFHLIFQAFDTAFWYPIFSHVLLLSKKSDFLHSSPVTVPLYKLLQNRTFIKARVIFTLSCGFSVGLSSDHSLQAEHSNTVIRKLHMSCFGALSRSPTGKGSHLESPQNHEGLHHCICLHKFANMFLISKNKLCIIC